MDIVLRSVFVYLFILIFVRISGKRTLTEITTIDFILLLIIGEATQQAILSDDHSIIGAMLAVGTLICFDLLLARISKNWDLFDKITNGVPVIIFENGEPVLERMNEENIEIEDILESARRNQGLEGIDQIKYAILEKDGQISIVPQ